MERTEIQTEIGEIHYAVFKHQNFEMYDALSAKDVDRWDSRTHMVIITKIEDQFKIDFKLPDLNNLLVTLVTSSIWLNPNWMKSSSASNGI